MICVLRDMWKKNSIYLLAAIQLLFLVILPPMDGKMNFFRILIYAVFAVLSIALVLLFVKLYVLKGRIVFDGMFWGVVSFFALCGVSAIWGLFQEIPLNDIIRGILPFIWLVNIIILSQALTQENIVHLIIIIEGIAVFYSIRIFYFYFVYVAGNPYERVTFHLVQATSITPMIGSLIFGYFYIKDSYKTYLIFSMLCYMATFLTATKSMLLALLFGWIFLISLVLAFQRKNLKDKKFIIKNILFICTFIFICTGVLLITTNLGYRWKNMVTMNEEKEISVEEGSVTVRIIEIKTALKCLKESPILGKGIGYRWSAEGIDYGGPIIYMHNIIAFFMTDFGLVGVLFMILILFIMLRMLIKVWKRKNIFWENKINFFAWYSILGMAFVYANFFAVYRSIEYIVMCAVFFAALNLVYKKVINEDTAIGEI